MNNYAKIILEVKQNMKTEQKSITSLGKILKQELQLRTTERSETLAKKLIVIMDDA